MTTKQLQAGDFVTPTVRLVRLLAEGGMGRVWVAEHLGLQAQVVVKLMAPEMAARSDGAERFTREAAVAAAIKSPHVVQVFDHGVTGDGTPYIVMELLEGRDLGAHLAALPAGRMVPNDVVTIVCQIGKALSKAHKASIIHRDIKPENIFLCDSSEGGELFVKLLDFGTARRESETRSRTTVPGQIMGTPYYMSPEQSVGAADLDERTDIWSLGVVAFEALTGQRPFEGSSVGAIAIAIHGPTPKMTAFASDLPPALDAWFARACAPEPQDRWPTIREAMSALVEAVTGAPPIESLTESIHFPEPIAAPLAITSVAPTSAPIRPLISTLPVAGSEKRFTTIAAGVVIAAAAVAMGAIVFGRSPAAPPAPAMTHAAEVPARPPAPVVEPPTALATSQATAEATPEPHGAEPTAPTTTIATPPPPARPAPPSARAKATKVLAAHARAKASTTTVKPPGEVDDDLERLTNVTSKRIEPAEAPAPAPPPPPLTPSVPFD